MNTNRLRRNLVQGGRGAVSLFLAVLLTPFLTVAVLMVEVQKYNSSVSIMDEAMGVSATSVLADYDEFLMDRWGLTAVDQGTDVSLEYSQALDVNAKALGNSITLNTVSASGVEDSSLANSDVLYNQVQEFSKLNAPITLAEETLNLSDLIGSLEKINNVNLIAKLVDGLSSTADSMIDFGEKAEKLKKASEALDSRSSDLASKFNAFRDAANGLIDACAALDDAKNDVSQSQQALETAKQAVTTYEAEVKEHQTQIDERKKKQESLDAESEEYKKLQGEIEELQKKIEEVKKAHKNDYQKVESRESEVQTARQKVTEQERTVESHRTSASSAQQEYSSSLSSALAELDTYLSEVKACNKALKDAEKSTSDALKASISLATKPESEEKSKSFATVDSELKTLKDQGKESSAEYAAKSQERNQLVSEMADIDAVNTANDAVNAGVSASAKEWSEQFASDWDAKINSCMDSLSSVKTSVDAFPAASATSSTAKVTEGSCYQALSSSGYIGADKIDAYLKKQKEDAFEGSLSSFIEGMSAAMDAMFSMSLFYDGDLSASIDTGYYQNAVGGLPGSGMAEGGLLAVVTDVSGIMGSASDFGESVFSLNFLDAWKAVKKFAESCSGFVTHVTAFVTTVGQNAVDLFTNYERLYYSTYAAYNTACRTDTSTMSGGAPELEDEKHVGPAAIRDVQGLIDTLKSFMHGTGDEKAFCGAELEYLLFGSTSEVANQLFAFSGIYLIRLIASLPAVFLNAEVQAMAASTTIGAPVVLLVVALLEPLVDAILLVNGEKIDLYETKMHLTPSGVVDLVAAFVRIGARGMEESLKEDVLSAFDVNGDAYQAELGKRQGSGGAVSSDASTGKFSKAWSSYTGGLLSFSYREYCFMVLLATVGKDEQMARLANLVQMESTLHYQKNGAPFTFDLKKSYSFVQAEADISVKQLLPSLTDSRWFTIKRVQYRGY